VTNRADGSYLDFYDSINRIEGNILTLYNSYGIAPVGWQTPKTNWSYDQQFSYKDTNRIEGNEQALYQMVNGIIQEYVVCGQSLNLCAMTWNN
jgi:spore cortex formation protein SpoVR/YcgB (stage V sporulation)